MDPALGFLLLCIVVGVPVLAIVGLVVTVRAIWRGITAASSDAVREERVRCGSCGRWSPRSRYRCDGCGRSLLGGEAAELADRSAFLRQLQRLREANVLESELVNDLVARTAAHYQRLEEKRRAAAEPSRGADRQFAPPAAAKPASSAASNM